MDILRLVVGVILLSLGRRLFWLFVGVVGFLVGFNLGTQYLQNQPGWVVIILAVILGLIGAVLATFIQGIVIAIAGFLAGGYLATTLLNTLANNPTGFSWLAFIIGGIVGIILVAWIFDWALIILSSLLGAQLIVQALNVGPGLFVPAYIILLLVGIAIQAGVKWAGKGKSVRK